MIYKTKQTGLFDLLMLVAQNLSFESLVIVKRAKITESYSCLKKEATLHCIVLYTIMLLRIILFRCCSFFFIPHYFFWIRILTKKDKYCLKLGIVVQFAYYRPIFKYLVLSLRVTKG